MRLLWLLDDRTVPGPEASKPGDLNLRLSVGHLAVGATFGLTLGIAGLLQFEVLAVCGGLSGIARSSQIIALYSGDKLASGDGVAFVDGESLDRPMMRELTTTSFASTVPMS